MMQGTGTTMYTGCFYLYDEKIRPLWPIIFRGNRFLISVSQYFYCSLVCRLPGISHVQFYHLHHSGMCRCHAGG